MRTQKIGRELVSSAVSWYNGTNEKPAIPEGRAVADVTYDGGYLRFEGEATVERLECGKTVERVSDPAVWELMYFGKSCADEKYKEKIKNKI